MNNLCLLVLTSSAIAEFSRLYIVGPFKSALRASFLCPWSSGDVTSDVMPVSLIPAIYSRWADGFINSTEFTGYIARPQPTSLYNTPFAVGVQLTYAMPATSLFEVSPNLTSWTNLTNNPASEISCSLGAAVNGAPILLVGISTVQPTVNGLLVFPSISLLPASPNAFSDPPQVVIVTASCQVRGNDLLPLTASVVIERLSVGFVQRPPAFSLPASVSEPLPFTPAVSVAILKSNGDVLVTESSAACTVSIAAQAFAPFVVKASQQMSLLGLIRSSVSNGVATFPGLSVSGPLGSSVTLNFDCTRAVGGVIFGTSATVVVSVVEAKWTPPLLSLWQLYSTPVLAKARLQEFVPDPSNGWTAVGSPPKPPSPLVCSLEVASKGANGIRINSATYFGSLGASGVSDALGDVFFAMSLSGKSGETDNVTATCSVAGQFFSTPPIEIAIETVSLVPVSFPPSVWIPSFASARTPFFPVPSVLFVTKNDRVPVDAREASCQFSIASSNASILEPPLAGYKLPPLAGSTQVDATGAVVVNETDVVRLASNTPILFTNVFVQTKAFGLVLDMSVTCQRSQGDATDPYSWKLRIVDADFEYISQPPAAIISQSTFSFNVRLFDRGAEPLNFKVGDGVDHFPTLILDNVTVCTVALVTVDKFIILQNADAQSENGLVNFLGVSLAARSGSEVKGVVSCALGELKYPSVLPWSITMQPCGPGTAPAGSGGYTCSTCASSTYSDGGVGVESCTSCPSQGVSCAGGLLVLLPGFSRTQDGALTIDGSTELNPCWAIEGCWVNRNASDYNRAASHTHGCNKGYSGPLCGICDAGESYAKAGGLCVPCGDFYVNLVVVSFVPFIIVALVAWISFYRKVEVSSKSQVLFRILLTYMQTLGTLSSIYLARGTARFRAMFGFTTAAGDSPLTLTPIQCILRPPYYLRFVITVSLPFSVAALVLLANLMSITMTRCRQVCCKQAKKIAGSSRLIRSRSTRDSLNGERLKNEPAIDSLALNKSPDESNEPFISQLRADINRFFKNQMWVAPLIFVLNAGYSSLTTTSFNIFNCLPYTVGGTTYLAQDLSVTCFDGIHNGFRGFAGLLIASFGAGFPLLFAYILYRQRADLKKPEIFARFGFLYDGYSIERDMFAWESMIMVRKAAVVMIGSLVKDEYRQIFSSVSLLAVSLYLQTTYQPYEETQFNRIEGAALLTIMLTQLIAMFYLRIDSQTKQCLSERDEFVIDLQGTTCRSVRATTDAEDLTTTVMMALVNIVFMLVVIYMMISFVTEEAMTKAPNGFVARSVRKLTKRLASFHSQRKSIQSNTLKKSLSGFDSKSLSIVSTDSDPTNVDVAKADAAKAFRPIGRSKISIQRQQSKFSFQPLPKIDSTDAATTLNTGFQVAQKADVIDRSFFSRFALFPESSHPSAGVGIQDDSSSSYSNPLFQKPAPAQSLRTLSSSSSLNDTVPDPSSLSSRSIISSIDATNQSVSSAIVLPISDLSEDKDEDNERVSVNDDENKQEEEEKEEEEMHADNDVHDNEDLEKNESSSQNSTEEAVDEPYCEDILGGIDSKGRQIYLDDNGRRLQRNWRRWRDSTDVWYKNDFTGETLWEPPLQRVLNRSKSGKTSISTGVNDE